MTAEGDELEFDEVVMTTPLGWLKRNLDSFIPPLPPRLISGIGNLSVGKLEKVVLSSNSPSSLPPTMILFPYHIPFAKTEV